MGISDRIEAFILELMKQTEESPLRIQRNELAQLFGCVPSQINYVISTRFSPERGYSVESRRGGGGYITIKRMPEAGIRIYTADTATEDEAVSLIEKLSGLGVIDSRTAAVMLAAVSEAALGRTGDNTGVRSDILKCMLKAL